MPSRAEAESFRLKEADVIRQEEFQAIQVLKREGMKKRKVAEILGMDRKTVQKYVYGSKIVMWHLCQERAHG